MEIKKILTEIKALISETTNPVLLHMIAVNYNWDLRIYRYKLEKVYRKTET